MGMGIGINTERPDEGRIKGFQEPVACYVWFTSTGKVMPKRLKYQRKDGSIGQIDHIHVMTSQHKNYCGIPTIEYECNCMIADRSTTSGFFTIWKNTNGRYTGNIGKATVPEDGLRAVLFSYSVFAHISNVERAQKVLANILKLSGRNNNKTNNNLQKRAVYEKFVLLFSGIRGMYRSICGRTASCQIARKKVY